MNKLTVLLLLCIIFFSCEYKSKSNDACTKTEDHLHEKDQNLKNQKKKHDVFKIIFECTTYINQQIADVSIEIYVVKFEDDVLQSIIYDGDSIDVMQDIHPELKAEIINSCKNKQKDKISTFTISCGSGCAMTYVEQ